MPAALVMSATRTLLRASAQRLVAPGEVLERVNDVLVDDIPPNMFVTCLYAVLEPARFQRTLDGAGFGEIDPFVERLDQRFYAGVGKALGQALRQWIARLPSLRPLDDTHYREAMQDLPAQNLDDILDGPTRLEIAGRRVYEDAVGGAAPSAGRR